MKKFKLVRPVVLLLCLVSGLILSIGADVRSFADSTTGNGDSFGYCTVRTGSKTERAHVVSSVFKVKDGTYAVGVQNSFRSYVEANFAGGVDSSPTCYTTIDSYQEAADSRNDWIARLRSDGLNVYTVSWSYRGD